MKTNITKVNIPTASILLNNGKIYDYSDSYQTYYLDKNSNISSTQIGKAFFTSAPKWSENLFELRNRIVSVFGLKISEKNKDRQQQLDSFTCEPGSSLGLFNVYSKTENEIILGEDDKHLNFRISLLKENNQTQNKKLTITTVVEYNHWFGKLYFLPVKPFHKLIVPKMLKGIVKSLNNENKELSN
ncbi:DUF2867 domain-containing protein [Algibacter sp. PT7-4]|uniref:DUF2867 domain-containing protein n=1 Tax=Algibacter ulvanivorans TaxID=3400999 RepID=UPI003AACEE9B